LEVKTGKLAEDGVIRNGFMWRQVKTDNRKNGDRSAELEGELDHFCHRMIMGELCHPHTYLVLDNAPGIQSVFQILDSKI